jgi:SEC-C motif
VSTKLGRNDPCHCGSGKKYKRCHVAADKQLNSPAHESSESSESPSSPPDAGQVASLLKKLSRNSPQKERAEFEQLLAQTKPIMAYLEHQAEIEAASTVLEAHREEFDRLIEDEKAYLDRVDALFAEERFAPLWFTAADIRRAFESVGFPPNLSPSDQMFETLRAAILHLADKDRRTELAMNLLLHLPHYMAAGRHLDGWLIQDCAHITAEVADESNPFLFQMFSHGYDAWANEQRARDEELLQEVGMDPARLRGMSLEEIDDWLEAQQADPIKKARMEALMQANPDQRALAVTNLERMERDSIKLLEREDARALLLTPQEVEPWLAALSRRCESAQDLLPQLSADSPPDAATTKAFADAIWPAVGEMAQSIFTPERIQQLTSQLKKYRSEQFTAGDKVAAGCAMGAIASLEREDDPSRNYFLNALCFASLREFTGACANPDSHDGAAAPPAEPAS